MLNLNYSTSKSIIRMFRLTGNIERRNKKTGEEEKLDTANLP